MFQRSYHTKAHDLYHKFHMITFAGYSIKCQTMVIQSGIMDIILIILCECIYNVYATHIYIHVPINDLYITKGTCPRVYGLTLPIPISMKSHA